MKSFSSKYKVFTFNQIMDLTLLKTPQICSYRCFGSKH